MKKKTGGQLETAISIAVEAHRGEPDKERSSHEKIGDQANNESKEVGQHNASKALAAMAQCCDALSRTSSS